MGALMDTGTAQVFEILEREWHLAPVVGHKAIYGIILRRMGHK
jgi:hypothetical protein